LYHLSMIMHKTYALIKNTNTLLLGGLKRMLSALIQANKLKSQA